MGWTWSGQGGFTTSTGAEWWSGKQEVGDAEQVKNSSESLEEISWCHLLWLLIWFLFLVVFAASLRSSPFTWASLWFAGSTNYKAAGVEPSELGLLFSQSWALTKTGAAPFMCENQMGLQTSAVSEGPVKLHHVAPFHCIPSGEACAGWLLCLKTTLFALVQNLSVGAGKLI